MVKSCARLYWPLRTRKKAGLQIAKATKQTFFIRYLEYADYRYFDMTTWILLIQLTACQHALFLKLKISQKHIRYNYNNLDVHGFLNKCSSAWCIFNPVNLPVAHKQTRINHSASLVNYLERRRGWIHHDHRAWYGRKI